MSALDSEKDDVVRVENVNGTENAQEVAVEGDSLEEHSTEQIDAVPTLPADEQHAPPAEDDDGHAAVGRTVVFPPSDAGAIDEKVHSLFLSQFTFTEEPLEWSLESF